MKLPTIPKPKSVIKKSATPPSTKQTKIYVRLLDSNNEEQLLSLKNVIDTNNGPVDVVLVLGPPDKKQIIKLPGGVTADEGVLDKLRDLVGAQHVVVQ